MLYLSTTTQATIRRVLSVLLKIALSILACWIVLFIIMWNSVIRVNIQGNSMMPFIHNGDRLLMSSFFLKPKVGKVYSIAAGATYANPKMGMVKRVIAGPGDVLEFNAHSGEWLSYNGQAVVINEHSDLPRYKKHSEEADSKGAVLSLVPAFNQLMQLPMYRLLPDQPLHSASQQRFYKRVLKYPFIQQRAAANGLTKVTVPAGHYFVMSDNWGSNLDSRFFGPLPEQVFKYYFVSKRKPVEK